MIDANKLETPLPEPLRRLARDHIYLGGATPLNELEGLLVLNELRRLFENLEWVEKLTSMKDPQ